MKKLILILCLLTIGAVSTRGQFPTKEVIKLSSAPVGTACLDGRIYYVSTTGVNYERINGVCAAITSGGTPGTVNTSGSPASPQLAKFSSGTAITTATATDVSTPSQCADAGANDTYACNLAPVIASYTVGTKLRFFANTANTGGASINFNSVGALTIVKMAGGITTALATGDINAGQWVEGTIATGSNFQMTSQVGGSAGITNSASNGQVPISDGTNLTGDADLTFSGDTLNATKISGALNGTVGATTPAAGNFTTLGASGAITQTSNSATAFESGPNGGTNPVFRLVNSTASQATGLSVTGAASGGGVLLTALGGTNEPLQLVSKGTGSVYVKANSGATADNFRVDDENGNSMFRVNRNQYQSYFGSGGVYVIDGANGLLTLPGGGEIRAGSYANFFITNPTIRWPSNSPDVGISKASTGVLGIGTGAQGSVAGSLAFVGLTASGATQTLSNAAFTTCTALTTSSNVLACTVSDRSVKQGFHRFTKGLNFVRNARPQTYSFKEGTPYFDHGRTRIGLVAQDVEQYLPEAVIPVGNGLKQIDYNAVTTAMLSVVQNLESRVTALEKQNARLRAQLRRRN